MNKIVILIFLFCISVLGNEPKFDKYEILINGHASHFQHRDEGGVKYNEKNYGVGFLYHFNDTLLDLGHLSVGANYMIDSYKNSMYFINVSKYFNIFNSDRDYFNNIDFNFTFLYGKKEIKYYRGIRDSDELEFSRWHLENIVGAAPGLNINLYRNIYLNYQYLPRISDALCGLHFFNLGLKF